MDFKKFGNFNWIEMDSKDQNLDLIRAKRIHFCPFQSIFACWISNLIDPQVMPKNCVADVGRFRNDIVSIKYLMFAATTRNAIRRTRLS